MSLQDVSLGLSMDEFGAILVFIPVILLSGFFVGGLVVANALGIPKMISGTILLGVTGVAFVGGMYVFATRVIDW